MRRVVGVIGHVDHGKTSLVRALTGMETDRLAEEKRRGISIALGFAYFTGDGMTVDLVDLPGHERFIRTMVSGATGIDAAMMVVAANEGIKPQTVEHLNIAGLLGVRHVVVAVSKADLASPAEAQRVAEAAAALARTAGISVCGSVLTSAASGLGVEQLRATLRAALPEAPPALDGFAYLPIDRAFSMPGHGTVVTGTLRRGPLATSDEVAIVPGHGAVRLRSLQVHGARTMVAQPGQRVAVNVRDVEPGQVGRGAALTARDTLPVSRWLTVSVQAIDGAPALPTTTALVLLFGTEEMAARLRLLDCDTLEPGQRALAQLHCAAAVSVPARERFILRRASPAETLAGGRVIDPAAARLRRHAPGVLARLRTLVEADPAGILHAELAAAGACGVALVRLAQMAGVSPGRAAEMLQAMPAALGRSRVAVLQAEYDRVLAALPPAIGAQDSDTPVGKLAALLPWAGAAVLDDALGELVRRGTVLRVGGAARLPMQQRDQDRAAQELARGLALAEAIRKAGLSPPAPEALAPGPQTKRLVELLVREGVLVRAVDRMQKREILFHRDAIALAKRRLTPLLAEPPGILVSEAGAALGISRKYCVPLLEHLDAVRFTRRVGDRRLLAQ